MENINFKNLNDYMNDEDIYKALRVMTYAMACAVIDAMDIVPDYAVENDTNNTDDNYLWRVYEFDCGYLELHTCAGGNFVNTYDTLEELVESNEWLTYDEEDDDFYAIEEEI